MKTIVSVLTAAALAVTAAAPAKSQSRIAPETEAFCLQLGEMAGVIMDLRQSGSVMSDVIAPAPSEIRDLAISVAVAAFQHPRYSTFANQQQAIRDFRSEQEADCYRFALSE
jgi:hypothetical protein